MTALPVGDVDLAGFDVEFVERSGARRREPLIQCWGTRFEHDVLPVRAFSTTRRPGEVSFPGFRWAATSGRHVGYESWLEKRHAVLLDFDADVTGFSSQPFWLRWHDGSRVRRHAPDFFARRRDGAGIVVDVRPDDRIGEKDAELFAATAWACEQVGWLFRRVGEVPAILAANLRWLSGYRHPRCWRSELAESLLAVFSRPTALFDGAEQAGGGNRIAALPVLFHLMWRHRLTADLDSRLLGPDTLVTAAAGGA